MQYGQAFLQYSNAISNWDANNPALQMLATTFQASHNGASVNIFDLGGIALNVRLQSEILIPDLAWVVIQEKRKEEQYLEIWHSWQGYILYLPWAVFMLQFHGIHQNDSMKACTIIQETFENLNEKKRTLQYAWFAIDVTQLWHTSQTARLPKTIHAIMAGWQQFFGDTYVAYA